MGQQRGEGVVPADGGLRRFDSETLVHCGKVHLRLDATVHRAELKEDTAHLLRLSRPATKVVTVVCPEVMTHLSCRNQLAYT
jgi:hypothetical protein